MAAGTMEGIRYREYQLTLEPGARLFVYSDGLPEANDPEEKLFGIDRTLRALNLSPDAPPEEILKTVRREVDAFVGDAPQFDDLTMMCLAYWGPEVQLSAPPEAGEQTEDGRPEHE